MMKNVFQYFLVRLRARQLFHTTYKMYMVSLSCEVVFLFITCIYLGRYAETGVENRGIKTFGKIVFYRLILNKIQLICCLKGEYLNRYRR